MADESFVDTNILIYAYSTTEAEKKIHALSILRNEIVCLSTQVINEFVWVMNRKYNLDLEILQPIIGNLFDLYEVSTIHHSTISQAIRISGRHGFSYWDSLMISSALQSGCNLLYTEDLKHGQLIDDRLRIVNPFVENLG